MEFLEACHLLAREIRGAIGGLVGTEKGGVDLCIGADGTPTKEIDRAAEDCVIAFLEKYPLCRTLISEEAGRVEFGG